ncbi:MAG: hypothetical protein M1834_003456 [Cirrosporium novae-zelandiae]|nr:MAG: hypothetical protein M1834_003456 [Cirrosporium novae-zelandiae]
MSPINSPVSKKRKLEIELDEPEFETNNTPKTTKNKKKISKKRPKKNKSYDVSTTEYPFGQMDSSMLADYIAQNIRRFEKDLSPVELEERYLSESAFKDTSTWKDQRDLDHLPAFLEHFRPDRISSLSESSEFSGSPHTLYISAAALRVCDITRALRKFQTKTSLVAKLFAKHVKLAESIEYVRKTRIGIAVGTPSRLKDLIDADALSLDNCEQIIIDASYIDLKKRCIFDTKETQQPLMQLLNRQVQRQPGDLEKRTPNILFF